MSYRGLGATAESDALHRITLEGEKMWVVLPL
jgi:hypothetical protein